MTDVTISGCKDPVQRMQKLNERRQQLEDSIAQMRDQHYIIGAEIAECRREILQDKRFLHFDTIIVSRECPR